MSGERVVTQWDVDASGVEEGANKAADAVKRASDKMTRSGVATDKSFARTGRAAQESGKKLKASMDTSRGSMRGFEKGLSVASVSAGTMATSLSGAAREILLTGTALGFMGAAIAAGGLALGFLGNKIFSESESAKAQREQLDERTKSAEDRAKSLTDKAVDLDNQLRKMRGADVQADRIKKLDNAYKSLLKRQNALDTARKFREQSRARTPRSPTDAILELGEMAFGTSPEEMAEQGAKLGRQIAANRQERDSELDITRTTNETLKETLRIDAERVNRMAQATTEAKKFSAEMQGLGESLRRQGGPGNDRTIDDYIKQLNRARQTGIRNQFTEQADSLERANTLMAESNPVQRQLLAIEMERAAAHERIAGLAGDSSSTASSRLRNAINTNADARKRQISDAPYQALAQRGGAILESSIGDSLIAGVNGSREGVLAAFDGIAKGMQRVLIDALVEASGVRAGATSFFKQIFGAVAATSGEQTDGGGFAHDGMV